MIKLLILSFRAVAVATGFTIITLVAFGAGNVNLYITFLALGMIALAVSTIMQSSRQ